MSFGTYEIELLERILFVFDGGDASSNMWEFFISLYSCSYSSFDLLPEWNRIIIGNLSFL